MIVTYKYQLTDLGMNYNGVIQIIKDWTKCVYEEIPHLVGSDYKFVIMMHPALRHKTKIDSFALSMVPLNDPTRIPDDDGTFPGVVETTCTMMNLKIVVTAVLEPNELVITSEEFIPLVESFIKGATAVAYQKGALDAMRVNPGTKMYDENYVFVNLGDEKSMKMLLDKAMRRFKSGSR